MRTPPFKSLVPLDRIELFVQYEPALITLGLVVVAWILYYLFLSKIQGERNKLLRKLMSNLFYHMLLASALFAIYSILHRLPFQTVPIQRLQVYIGLATIFSGATVFVRAARILVFEYLFISHQKVAFPLLLVNLTSLLLSIILATWISAEIFDIKLTPILATSAIFSIVLGLAMQDTLGNLFSGVALQIDKPYEMGDWIEVQSGGQKWTGQVYEITWRATILIAFGEEMITIPNRIMGQAQISNFSTKFRPIIRIHIIRLPYHADIIQTKELLTQAILSVPEVRNNPPPAVYLHDTSESGVGYKLVYYIDNYGEQFQIVDRVLARSLVILKNAGYQFSGHRVVVSQDGHPEIAVTQ